MRKMRLVVPLCFALGACGQAPADPRGVERDEILLQVAARGRVDARPDEARFTAGVQTIAPTAAAASRGNGDVMNRVAAALERLGVNADDMQTKQITLSRIDYGPQRGRFQANNMVEIRMRDLKRVGEAIAATTEAGANVVSGPNMAVGDPEAAARSAYAQAYRAARQRADTYAEAAGLKVARILVIRDGGESGPAPFYGDGMVAAQAAAPPPVSPPPFRPGMNSSEVLVRADFALTAK